MFIRSVCKLWRTYQTCSQWCDLVRKCAFYADREDKLPVVSDHPLWLRGTPDCPSTHILVSTINASSRHCLGGRVLWKSRNHASATYYQSNYTILLYIIHLLLFSTPAPISSCTRALIRENEVFKIHVGHVILYDPCEWYLHGQCLWMFKFDGLTDMMSVVVCVLGVGAGYRAWH